MKKEETCRVPEGETAITWGQLIRGALYLLLVGVPLYLAFIFGEMRGWDRGWGSGYDCATYHAENPLAFMCP